MYMRERGGGAKRVGIGAAKPGQKKKRKPQKVKKGNHRGDVEKKKTFETARKAITRYRPLHGNTGNACQTIGRRSNAACE